MLQALWECRVDADPTIPSRHLPESPFAARTKIIVPRHRRPNFFFTDDSPRVFPSRCTDPINHPHRFRLCRVCECESHLPPPFLLFFFRRTKSVSVKGLPPIPDLGIIARAAAHCHEYKVPALDDHTTRFPFPWLQRNVPSSGSVSSVFRRFLFSEWTKFLVMAAMFFFFVLQI